MTTTRNLLAATVLLVSGAALAQTAPTTQSPVNGDVGHNVDEQRRIDAGLKSGQLTTQEAGRLEHQEAQVDRMEQKDLSNGSMTPQEQQRLAAQQKKVSQDVYSAKHNAAEGNPNSASSQRMQKDVQNDVKQQERIQYGVKNGTVTNKEVGGLERGQKRTDNAEAAAGAYGGVGAGEQERINKDQQVQGNHIYNKRNNDKQRQQPPH